MKKCSHCKQSKPVTEYHRNARHKDGLQYTCKSCRRKVSREWSRTPKAKAAQRKYRYSLDQEEYNLFVLKQKNKCAICGLESKLAVDHCHNSKVVRGLLCRHCNMGLGHFKDNLDSLKNAITYLEANQWEAVEK